MRLLDDISVVKQCISAYVAHDAAYDSTIAGCNDRVTDPLSHSSVAKVHQRRLDPAVATRHMYKALSHDGYACAIIDSHTETPLTFPQQALHGGYVVGVCALDVVKSGPVIHSTGSTFSQTVDDIDLGDDDVECGTWFTVFRRKSSHSVPGRLVDVQQNASEQVAAGYVLYSASTRLLYTLRCDGVFSFNLNPVTSQYFMAPSHALRIGEASRDVAKEDDCSDNGKV